MRYFSFIGWLICLLCGVHFPASAIPWSVFIVHCEPRNADEESLVNLGEIVALADQYGVKLTIDFTPPWAEMIVSDEDSMVQMLEWLAAGHEIGVHHHPYGVSKVRGTHWDGYTNIDPMTMPPADRSNYLGDMNQYLLLLNTLPGTRTSGTLGLGEEEDQGDWPDGLTYSAAGHSFDEIISQPEVVQYGDDFVWQMNHGLFWGATQSELENAYEGAEADEIFALVTHVSNYEDFPLGPQLLENFFIFLSEQNPSGSKLVTVTEAMSRTIESVPALSRIGLLLLMATLVLTAAARPMGISRLQLPYCIRRSGDHEIS